MQIQLEKTLDVEIVERELAVLWTQTMERREPDFDDSAVLRARVANLLVFVANESLLNETDPLVQELTTRHPSRVLLMMGDRQAADVDIEMFVSSHLQTDKRTGVRRLCCEEITLKARGNFTAELPSAALPLLVPDLSTFLWWRDAFRVFDKVFMSLASAAGRLIIDSAEFVNPEAELGQVNKLFEHDIAKDLGISDLNWARLTWWRSLLADFYDVPAYKPLLNQIDYVEIHYVAPEHAPEAKAPQALLLAGWLASRVVWNYQNAEGEGETVSFNFISSDNRAIKLELRRVEQGKRKPGRLVKVELRSSAQQDASFRVERSADDLYLLTEARLGPTTHRGRVLPVRNRSAVQLLSREIEILCNDDIYQEAVAVAALLTAESL
jgi:glucose-6-phosphate dehydrogenase assembly protein OpcA